jgi:hypothetical protein
MSKRVVSFIDDSFKKDLLEQLFGIVSQKKKNTKYLEFSYFIISSG